MPISPNQGSTGGGTTVTITGTNLANTTAVKFGTKSATITNVSPTQVTAISPSGTGTVGVTVTTPGGTSNPLSFFYVGAPFKSAPEPAPPGRSPAATPSPSTAPACRPPPVWPSAPTPPRPRSSPTAQLTVTVPAGAAAGSGRCQRHHRGRHQQRPVLHLRRRPHRSARSAPTSGPTSGGTAVTITGTNLATTQSVTFDGTPAPFSVINATTVSAVTPPGTAGAVDVVVTNPAGSDTAVGGFTYVAAPASDRFDRLHLRR